MSNLDPTAFCWYRSETQLGLMYVGVETSESEQANLQGPHCVFQQAALLSNTEVMIQAIELWQEIDLDLVPCEAPESTFLHLSLQLQGNANTSDNASATELAATSKNQVDTDESAVVDSTDDSAVESSDASEQVSGEQRARASDSGADTASHSNANASNHQPRIVMVFDCATLIQLKSLSQELQSVLSVTSSSIELRIQLDQLSITAEELEKIENGAVVVIPAAYQPEWGIVAISTTPEVPLRFGGTVEKGDQALQVQFAHHESNPSDNSANNPVGSDETSDDSITVWCKQLCSIPVKDLLGIDTSDQTTQLFSLDARELELVQGDSAIAHGSLLSYGRGSVVAISESERDREC